MVMYIKGNIVMGEICNLHCALGSISCTFISMRILNKAYNIEIYSPIKFTQLGNIIILYKNLLPKVFKWRSIENIKMVFPSFLKLKYKCCAPYRVWQVVDGERHGNEHCSEAA